MRRWRNVLAAGGLLLALAACVSPVSNDAIPLPQDAVLNEPRSEGPGNVQTDDEAESSGGAYYGAHFNARFAPAENAVIATITVHQQRGELRELDLAAPAVHFSAFSGDGEVVRRDDRLVWRVPRRGGALTYRVVVDHQRNGAYDAKMTESWALLRLDDLFPPAKTRTRKSALAHSWLTLEGPAAWTFETRYGRPAHRIDVSDPNRSFDRPTGWMVAGKIGVRRDAVAGRVVSVAAPVGQQLRRVDILAFLRWTLPELTAVFERFPQYLLIVGASDNMWRGGLSGPTSLYLHADRPLISENATSPLLHELIHVAIAQPPPAGSDWVTEGLAEYYSLEILRRSDGISAERHQRTMSTLASWVRKDGGHLTDPSTGANTACAVLVLESLADQLTAKGASLDDAVRLMLQQHGPDRAVLEEIVARLLGLPGHDLIRRTEAAACGQDQPA